MSGYRLCRTDVAEKPYYIESIGINIFSWEELCYYLVNDTPLLDETIMNKTLTAWIDRELHLPKLAQNLNRMITEDGSLADFVLPILKEDGYLDLRELQNFRVRLLKMGDEPRELRLKKKGDALVGRDKLKAAITSYRQILELPSLKVKDSFLAVVYHNMGVAYIRLLQYREALECFDKALKLAYTRDYLKTYLYAFALCKPREKYEEKLRELRVDEETRQEVSSELSEAASLAGENPGDTDAYLDSLTKAYHRAADV